MTSTSYHSGSQTQTIPSKLEVRLSVNLKAKVEKPLGEVSPTPLLLERREVNGFSVVEPGPESRYPDPAVSVSCNSHNCP